ncbi:ureidoglycolate lyase [Gymnodinialimonas ulvae]|uniref:ureidoglycolate lyase n=1 Tax=Gymnodinialimonas ulvae TaxID=3126504 RepID=UPI003095276A
MSARPEARGVQITARPITAKAFAPFGDVIETDTVPPQMINEGLCRRFSDLARFDQTGGRIAMSLFQAELREMPYRCNLLERHPLGSQCFIPMSQAAFLVIVAPDEGGRPGPASAFLATNDVAVNIARNTWHGVLAPISGSGLFAVIDRIGSGDNLEEHRLEEPVFVITTP